MTYSINKIINTGDLFKITKPNGDVIYIEIDAIGDLTGGQTDAFTLKTETHNFAYDLNLIIIDLDRSFNFPNSR